MYRSAILLILFSQKFRVFFLGRRLWGRFLFTIQSLIFVTFFFLWRAEEMKIKMEKVRKIRRMLEAFLFRFFVFLQGLFCKRPSCVVAVENDAYFFFVFSKIGRFSWIDASRMVSCYQYCIAVIFSPAWRNSTWIYPSRISPKRETTSSLDASPFLDTGSEHLPGSFQLCLHWMWW